MTPTTRLLCICLIVIGIPCLVVQTINSIADTLRRSATVEAETKLRWIGSDAVVIVKQSKSNAMSAYRMHWMPRR